MSDVPQHCEAPRDVFRRRLREARNRRGWDQKDLSARLEELGYTLDVSQISKIERGARKVFIDDVFALAAALDCSPLFLLVPRGDEELVKVTPGLPAAPADVVRDWTGGHSRV